MKLWQWKGNNCATWALSGTQICQLTHQNTKQRDKHKVWKIWLKDPLLSSGGLGVKRVESLDGPSAVPARQSDMPWPANPPCSRHGVLHWESCEFDHHEVLMFFHLIKKAMRILLHWKDAWQLGSCVAPVCWAWVSLSLSLLPTLLAWVPALRTTAKLDTGELADQSQRAKQPYCSRYLKPMEGSGRWGGHFVPWLMSSNRPCFLSPVLNSFSLSAEPEKGSEHKGSLSWHPWSKRKGSPSLSSSHWRQAGRVAWRGLQGTSFVEWGGEVDRRESLSQIRRKIKMILMFAENINISFFFALL